METYASEDFIAQRTGESIATVRQFVGALCDYQEVGNGEPFDEEEALKYISRTTDLSVRSIALMFVEYVGYMITCGMIEDTDYIHVRSWAQAICELESEAEWIN
jgi:hypothetical protein